MNWIVTRIKVIMLIAGVLTSTMLYAAVAPQAALESTFGEEWTAQLPRSSFVIGAP